MTAWDWEFSRDDGRWRLHTPDYTPEISIQLARVDDRMMIGMHKYTTMPHMVQRVLLKLVRSFDFFGESDKGVMKIVIHRDQIIESAGRVDELFEVLR